MRSYQSIRFIICLSLLSITGIFYWVHTTVSSGSRTKELQRPNEQYFVEVANQKADAIYLQWLKKYIPKVVELVPSAAAQKVLLEMTQSDFSKQVTREGLTKQVVRVMTRYGNTVLPNDEDRELLGMLVELLIEPEISLFVLESSRTPDEIKYHRLMNELEKEHTAVGTTLRTNALRYLTSTALLKALELLPKVMADQPRRLLEPAEKQKFLNDVALIITRQFTSNLAELEAVYGFEIPDNIESVILNKLVQFLDKKLFPLKLLSRT